MTIQIGKSIRELRKKQNITQERLAEYLNVSYQTVSKWENGLALPSAETLPSIANFFDISIDELYYLEGNARNDRIRYYEHEYRRLCQRGDNKGRVALMRSAVAEFPRNYNFMNYLARSLYWEEQVEEVFTLCRRILEECTQDTVRLSALWTLSRAYAAAGQKEKAEECAMRIPTLNQSREYLLAELYEGEKRKRLLQGNLLSSLYAAVKALAQLSEDDMFTHETQIEFLETGIRLLRSILDDNALWVNGPLYFNYERLARKYCRLGETKRALDYLLLAEKAAEDADRFFSRKEPQLFSSKFLKGLEASPQSFGKHWQESHCDNLLQYLQYDCFDSLRGEEPFLQIVENLQNKRTSPPKAGREVQT